MATIQIGTNGRRLPSRLRVLISISSAAPNFASAPAGQMAGVELPVMNAP
jgi:hypothetical protein